MYEENPATVTTALNTSSSTTFSAETIDKILKLTTSASDTTVSISENVVPAVNGLFTVASGTEVAFVTPGNGVTSLTATTNIPVTILQGANGVNLTLNAGQVTLPSAEGKTDRVVVGSAGADKIVIADARNSHIVIGQGDTVVAGAGADTIVAGMGSSTIVGGTGHAIVKMQGSQLNYAVTSSNGHAIVTNGALGQTTDISKIQYVQLDNGKALVFAKDTTEAAVTTLYETAFGRTADAGGLNYWFERAKAGDSLLNIAKGFTQSAEFAQQAALSDSAFVNSLYLHTFGRNGETDGLAYWTQVLQSGASRADLIASFSTIASHHIDGTQTVNVEAQVIGSVTIVHNIF